VQVFLFSLRGVWRRQSLWGDRVGYKRVGSEASSFREWQTVRCLDSPHFQVEAKILTWNDEGAPQITH